MWWNERKINFYQRAANNCNFHEDLSSTLLPYLNKQSKIVEFGCGLGYLTKTLRVKGFDIIGCDIENLPLSFASSNFPNCKFMLTDCYDLKQHFDIGICCFFGKILEKDNFERLFSNVNKLIYIENEHSSSSFSHSKEIENFLIKKGFHYELTRVQLEFNQPLKIEEKQSFIDTYYTSRNRTCTLEFKEQENSEFPLIAINKKNIGIFCITKEIL